MEVLQIKTFDKETCAKIYKAIGANCYKGDCHKLDVAECNNFVFNDWVTIKDLDVDLQLGFNVFLTENGWYVPTIFVKYFRTINI